MEQTDLRNIRAWLRLYIVGAWILLLQLFRTIARPRHVAQHAASDLSHIAVVMTGASSGIGRALCLSLLARGATVIAIAGPSGCTPAGCIRVMEADLRDTRSAAVAATCVREALTATSRPRVVLVHAAGTLSPRDAHAAAAVNLVSPAVLSVLLRDVVHAAVFLGSAAQAAAPELPRTLCGCARVPREGYPLAKALLHVFADAWGQHTAQKVVVVHPGVVATPLYDAECGIVGRLLRLALRRIAWDAETSAQRILDVLQRTGVLDVETASCNGQAEYWDTSMMSQAQLPKMICGRENKVPRDLSERMWNEVLELITNIDNRK